MGLMGFIWMLIIGLIVGALARFFYPGAINMTLVGTLVLGVIGSLIGGVIGSLFSGGRGFRPAGIILSVIGSMIALYVWLHYMR